MNPFVILKRNKIRLCIYMLLFFSNASCGQNRIVISDKEQDSVVLYTLVRDKDLLRKVPIA